MLRSVCLVLGLAWSVHAEPPQKPQEARKTQKLERLLPEDTALAVVAPDVARTKARLKASSLGRLFDEPEVTAFLEGPLARLDEFAHHLFAVPCKRALYARLGETAEDSLLCLEVDGAAGNAAVAKLIARAEKDVFGDWRRTRTMHHGVAIVEYASAHNLGAPAGLRCWALHDGLFAAANRPELLHALLARRAPRAGAAAPASLADDKTFRDTAARAGGDGTTPDLVVYASSLEPVARLLAGAKVDPKLLAGLGARDARGVRLQVSVSPESVDAHLFCGVPGKKRGLFALWDRPNGALLPPRWVPSSTASMGLRAISAATLYGQALEVAKAVAPVEAQHLAMGLPMMMQMWGIDWQKDVLGALGPTFCWYLLVPQANAPGALAPGGGINPPQLVMGMPSAAPKRLAGSLTKLFANIPVLTLSEKKAEGNTIRTGSVGLPGGEVSWVALKDDFFLALQPSRLVELIARYGRDKPALADSASFQRATKDLPKKGVGLSYADTPRALRHGIVATLAEWAQWIDPNLFPSEQTLRRHLGPCASVTVNEKDGVSYRFRQLLKKENK